MFRGYLTHNYRCSAEPNISAYKKSFDTRIVFHNAHARSDKDAKQIFILKEKGRFLERIWCPGKQAQQSEKSPMQMKSSCEKCQELLNLDSLAYVCSYECTYCGPCFEKFEGICPNCSGELLVRPKRGSTPGAVVQIEKFKTRDFDELVRLFDSYRQFYGQASNLQTARSFLEERLKNQESVIFVARRARQLIGFTQLYPMFTSVGAARTWILNDLYIASSTRTVGAGTKLVRRAIEFAKDSGASKIILETAEDNVKAQSIYDKLGFKRVEKVLSYSLVFREKPPQKTA